MRPELSIVISVRDNWRQLAECVDSIANQNGPPRLEVVVIDDGSKTPLPARAAESMQHVQLRVLRQTALGIAAARNRGLELTTGELIVFVDSDCLLEPNCLKNSQFPLWTGLWCNKSRSSDFGSCRNLFCFSRVISSTPTPPALLFVHLMSCSLKIFSTLASLEDLTRSSWHN